MIFQSLNIRNINCTFKRLDNLAGASLAEERVVLFRPFSVYSPSKTIQNERIQIKEYENLDKKWLRLKKKNYFCKKYSSHWTFLLNNSYICNAAENLWQTWHRKRLAFSMLMNLDPHLEIWKGKDVLPFVMIVEDCILLLHTRVWAVLLIFLQAVQGLSAD